MSNAHTPRRAVHTSGLPHELEELIHRRRLLRPGAETSGRENRRLICLLTSPGNADGVLAALPATATWIDMTSSSPAMGQVLLASAQRHDPAP